MKIPPPIKKCHFCNKMRPAWYQLELAPSHEIVYCCDDCFDEDKIVEVPDKQ